MIFKFGRSLYIKATFAKFRGLENKKVLSYCLAIVLTIPFAIIWSPNPK